MNSLRLICLTLLLAAGTSPVFAQRHPGGGPPAGAGGAGAGASGAPGTAMGGAGAANRNEAATLPA